MISVECESCKASYQLDERRLPAAGIKMRCTKCGTSFMVYPGGAPPGTPEASPPRPPSAVSKHTLLGVAAAAPPPLAVPPPIESTKRITAKHTIVGSPLAPQPAVPPPLPTADHDIDLPAPRAAARPPLPPALLEDRVGWG